MKYKPHKLIVTALRKKDKIKIKPFYCSLQPPLSLTSSSSLFFYLLLVGFCTHWSSQIWLSKTTITNSTSGPSRPITRKSWQILLSFTLFVCFALLCILSSPDSDLAFVFSGTNDTNRGRRRLYESTVANAIATRELLRPLFNPC